ncbi:MAG: hypothetical protein WBG50_01010 [Desulfomonilaceae bacterium]
MTAVPTLSEMSRPSRLVIDIPAASVAAEPQIIGLEKNSALRIRIAKTGKGAQVVLDFGASPVPDHKLHRIDDYLIVLLGEWQTQQRAQTPPKPARTPEEHAVAAPRQSPQVVTHAAGSTLLIKSVGETNGVIVLKAAKKTQPRHVYRIDIGVDFQNLGFKEANVYPVGGHQNRNTLAAGMGRSWARPSAQGKKIGPRKMLPQAVRGSKVRAKVRKQSAHSRLSALELARRKVTTHLNRIAPGIVREPVHIAGGVTRNGVKWQHPAGTPKSSSGLARVPQDRTGFRPRVGMSIPQSAGQLRVNTIRPYRPAPAASKWHFANVTRSSTVCNSR